MKALNAEMMDVEVSAELVPKRHLSARRVNASWLPHVFQTVLRRNAEATVVVEPAVRVKREQAVWRAASAVSRSVSPIVVRSLAVTMAAGAHADSARMDLFAKRIHQ